MTRHHSPGGPPSVAPYWLRLFPLDTVPSGETHFGGFCQATGQGAVTLVSDDSYGWHPNSWKCWA